jgi:hypothetical protein
MDPTKSRGKQSGTIGAVYRSPTANEAQMKNRFDILPRYVSLLHTQFCYFPMAAGMRERVKYIVIGVLN